MLRRATVDFGDTLREWDGFGVNYVETAQTFDPDEDPQEYGGFSILEGEDRRKVLRMVFGEGGLKPSLVKMFLDPFHQPEPGPGYALGEPEIDLEAYDHESTTRWMRTFAREGCQMTRERGDDLQIIATLYGPPAWMTKQRVVRGRDLDPAMKAECAKYIASWALYLRRAEGLPVRYCSLHNEGEDWMRWNEAGTEGGRGDDYNMYWPPEQVAEFLSLLPDVLEANGMKEVGATPGETTNWFRFAEWGYPRAILNHPDALRKMGLITSHGFWSPGFHRWAGDWRSTGIDMLRAERPNLHAWVTSTSWSDMDVEFVGELRESIYAAKVNGIIPWACVQRPSLWVGDDPNPGSAFHVTDEGELKVLPGYWWYKQACRAGRPGTAVARVVSNDSQVRLMAFADNGTGEGDAFVALNLSEETKEVRVRVVGSPAESWTARRTSESEHYVEAGRFPAEGDRVSCSLPPRSATTFFGE